MNTQQLKEFIDANKRRITPENTFSRCVDGRYEENNSPVGVIAKPGGDAGDVLVAFAALKSMELENAVDTHEVIATVEESMGGADKFAYHSDTHAGDIHGMGCGHLKFAKLDPEKYGVSSHQVETLFNTLPQYESNQVILDGDHKEKAVVVVDSETHGLLPMRKTEAGEEQVFVYHKTLHESQFTRLAEKLKEMLSRVNVQKSVHEICDALNAAFSRQLGATLEKLAVGLPVYAVQISDSDVTIDPA